MTRSSTSPARWLLITLRSLCVSVALIGLIEVVGLASPAAWAQDDRPAESAPSADGEPKQNGAVAAIGRAHEMISSRITETADRLDAFLGKPRILEESNRSYLKLAVLRISDEDGMEIRKEIKLKIVLPRLQDRLQLIIEQTATERRSFRRPGPDSPKT